MDAPDEKLSGLNFKNLDDDVVESLIDENPYK